jgi:hypothetical protein
MFRQTYIRPAYRWDSGLTRDWRARFERLGVQFKRAARDEESWTTIVVAALVVDLRQPVANAVAEIAANLDATQFEAKLNAVLNPTNSTDRRRCRRWLGRLEVDLLRASDFLSPGKARLLQSMGIPHDADLCDLFGAPDPNKAILVWHCHLIIDNRNRPDDYTRALDKAFPGERRVGRSTSIS